MQVNHARRRLLAVTALGVRAPPSTRSTPTVAEPPTPYGFRCVLKNETIRWRASFADGSW